MPLNAYYFFTCTFPERLLYHIKIGRKKLLLVRRSRKQKWKKTAIMAESYTTSSRKCLFQTFTAVSGCSSLRKAAQTPMLTGKLFSEEGCTDTNAYWKASVLRKAAQTPMLTGKLFSEGCTDTNAYWNAPVLRKAAPTLMTLNPFTPEKGVAPGWIFLF